MAMSSFSHIVDDVMSIVGSLQSNYFSHVNRHGNAVAHAPASRSIFSFISFDETYSYRHPKHSCIKKKKKIQHYFKGISLTPQDEQT